MNYDRETIESANWISLSKNEDVRGWSHSSIYPYVPAFLMSVLMILAGLILPFVVNVEGLLLYGILALIPIGILTIVLEYIKYITVFYVFTDDRVFRKRGVLKHYTRSVGYDSIDKVKTEQSLIGRILKFGDLKVITATPTEEDIVLTYLPDLQEGNNIISDYTGYKASRRDKQDIEEGNYRKEK